MKNLLLSLLFVAALTTVSLGATYNQVYSYAQVTNGSGSTQVYAAAPDNDGSMYFQTYGPTTITKIASNGTISTLMTNGQWTMATAATGLTGFYGFDVLGSNLVFSDSGTDQVYKLNKSTGALSIWAYKTDIMNVTGGTNVALLTPNAAYNNAFYVYDSTSKSVLKINDGGISMYFTNVAATGGALSGGLTFDNSGRMIMGNTNNGIYRFDGSNVETLLTAANILAVIGGTSTTLGDIFYAPDGKVYFTAGASATKCLLSFDPSNPTGTLAYVLTNAELLEGPAASTNVYQLTWYNEALAFNCNAKSGFYVVPEPATMALLAFGGLFLRRFKK
jgi:hypothetical protein